MMVVVRKTYSGVRGMVQRARQIVLIVIGFILIVFGRSPHMPNLSHLDASGTAHADAASCSSCSDTGSCSCSCTDTDSSCAGSCSY